MKIKRFHFLILLPLLLAGCLSPATRVSILEGIADKLDPVPPVEAPVSTPTPEPVVTPPAPTPAPCRTWDSPPADLRGGGVWKPVAESGGKLVVLVNTRFRGHIAKAEILRADWSLIERGRFDGDTHNGCRPHYRFLRPGAEYGQNLILRLTLNDGSERAMNIADGAQRHDW